MSLQADTIFEEALTPERVRGFQLVYVILAGAIMFFMVMLLFFFGLGSDMDRAEASPAAMDALSMAMAVVTAVCLIGGQLFYMAALRSGRRGRDGGAGGSDLTGEAVDAMIRDVQRATITRAAIFDGAAFFGLVVCIVGMMQGVVFVHPVYLLNALPAFLQLAFLAITFPTRDKIVGLMRRREEGIRG